MRKPIALPNIAMTIQIPLESFIICSITIFLFPFLIHTLFSLNLSKRPVLFKTECLEKSKDGFFIKKDRNPTIFFCILYKLTNYSHEISILLSVITIFITLSLLLDVCPYPVILVLLSGCRIPLSAS